MYVFIQVLAGCDTSSIFKQSSLGFNSELFYSYTGGLFKTKKTVWQTILP